MILEFTPHEKNSKMLYCTATLNDGFFVVNADDFFYNFVGKLEKICFTDYICDDYKAEFLRGAERAETGEKIRLLIQMNGNVDTNQLVDVQMTMRIGTQGEKLFFLVIYNIDSVESTYMNNSDMNKRYRLYMSMFNGCMYDYDLETDVITFFKYNSLKPTILVKCSLQEFYDRFVSVGNNGEANSSFQEFYQNVKTARDYFVCKMEGPSFEDADKQVVYRVEGATIYKHNGMQLVAGVLKAMEADENLTIPYYATAEGKDSFTGLLNKRSCREYVYDMLEGNPKKHYMMVVDIDNFKQINDTRGHLYGDEVLLKVSGILNKCLLGRGIAGRFGGDEFFLFTNGMNNDLQVQSMLTCVQQMLREEFEKENMALTLSIGVSSYPRDGKDYESLFAMADKCLYEAKKNGKNQFVMTE